MAPSPDEIRAAVARIAASKPFVQSRRMQQFLTFIVENTLAGDLDRLKETVVGIEVFDRQPGYDPKSDSVVRTEARRLRSKLEQYYATEGAAETVIIRIDRGGYIPVFESGAERSLPLPASEVETRPEPTPVAAPTASVQRPSRSRWRLSLVAALGALLLLPLCWYVVSHSAPRPPLRVVPLTGNAGSELNPALSPDGRQIAYAWRRDGGDFDIYVKLVDLGDPVRLTSNSGHDISPSWSPDGQRIAFLRAAPSRTEVIVVPALGGSERVVLTLRGDLDQWKPYGPQNGGKSGPVWLKDGKSLIVSNGWKDEGYGLARVDLNGTHTLLTEPASGEQDFCPSVSPDGRFIAFVRGIPGAGDVHVVPVNGGSPRRLTHDHAVVSGVGWWNEDTLLFGSTRGGNTGLWHVRLSGQEVVATPFAAGSGAESPAGSASSKLIAYVVSTERDSIWRRSLAATAPPPRAERFIFSSRSDHSPRYSPDGTRIAFVSDRSGAWEIWMCLSDGSRATRLTSFGGVPVGSPRWSPDSRSLAFDATVGAHSAIWTLDVAGGGAPRQLKSMDCNNVIPNWSSDGQWVYFLAECKGVRNKLLKQNIASGEAILVAEETALDVTESADGRSLYFERPRRSLWRMPKEGGAATPVPELADARPARNWDITPEGIFFARRTADASSLSLLRFGRPAIIDLGPMEGDTVDGTPSLTVSPDRRWLLYAQQDPRRGNIMVAHHAHLN